MTSKQMKDINPFDKHVKEYLSKHGEDSLNEPNEMKKFVKNILVKNPELSNAIMVQYGGVVNTLNFCTTHLPLESKRPSSARPPSARPPSARPSSARPSSVPSARPSSALGARPSSALGARRTRPSTKIQPTQIVWNEQVPHNEPMKKLIRLIQKHICTTTHNNTHNNTFNNIIPELNVLALSFNYMPHMSMPHMAMPHMSTIIKQTLDKHKIIQPQALTEQPPPTPPFIKKITINCFPEDISITNNDIDCDIHPSKINEFEELINEIVEEIVEAYSPYPNLCNVLINLMVSELVSSLIPNSFGERPVTIMLQIMVTDRIKPLLHPRVFLIKFIAKNTIKELSILYPTPSGIVVKSINYLMYEKQ